MNSRQPIRRQMTQLANYALIKVLGNTVPRCMRREAARVYGASAWRQANQLPLKRYGRTIPNKHIVDWVIKEFYTPKNLQDSINESLK